MRAEAFDCAILLQNAFDAALVAWMAGIPERIGYRRDGRGLLLTRAIPVPEPGEIPRHERFYYLELLRRAGLMERFPPCDAIRLEGAEAARDCGLRELAAMGVHGPAIGISPGAAYGNAKRWLPERFAEAAAALRPAAVLLFGSAGERDLCETVALLAAAGLEVRNLAGRTTLAEFIDLAAACRLFLTNDSGRHARGLGAGRPHRGGVRRHRRHHHRPHRTARPRGPRARRMQPLPAPRMPHRPPLHDPRQGRSCGRRRFPTAGPLHMDSRNKILTLEQALALDPLCLLVVVAGLFDIRVEAARVAAAASELLADPTWTHETRS